jgi:hypothetical protein
MGGRFWGLAAGWLGPGGAAVGVAGLGGWLGLGGGLAGARGRARFQVAGVRFSSALGCAFLCRWFVAALPSLWGVASAVLSCIVGCLWCGWCGWLGVPPPGGCGASVPAGVCRRVGRGLGVAGFARGLGSVCPGWPVGRFLSRPSLSAGPVLFCPVPRGSLLLCPARLAGSGCRWLPVRSGLWAVARFGGVLCSLLSARLSLLVRSVAWSRSSRLAPSPSALSPSSVRVAGPRRWLCAAVLLPSAWLPPRWAAPAASRCSSLGPGPRWPRARLWPRLLWSLVAGPRSRSLALRRLWLLRLFCRGSPRRGCAVARLSAALVRSCFAAGVRCGSGGCSLAARCAAGGPRVGVGASAWFCPAPFGSASVGAPAFRLGSWLGLRLPSVPGLRRALFSAGCGLRCARCGSVSCPRRLRVVAPGLALTPGAAFPVAGWRLCGAEAVSPRAFLLAARLGRWLPSGQRAAAARALVLLRSGSCSGGA